MKRSTLPLLFCFAFVTLSGSCSEDRDLNARAFRVQDRAQLIGGPTGLGEVGDFMLVNDKIRVVVQDVTFNRGSGVFGGSLIDADLVRATNAGTALGGTGNDSFGEMFPAYFLEMIDPETVEIINDGSDGKAAIIEVSGKGGEFVTMLRYLNQLLVNSYKEPAQLLQELLGFEAPNSDAPPNIRFSTRYILEPGASHVRVESSLENIAFRELELPPRQIIDILRGAAGIDLGDFRLPLGHVLGFGATSTVFLPGIGFDLRQGLLDQLAVPVPLPGFPGALTQLVGSKNTNGVNYGFAYSDDPADNFVVQRDLEGESYQGRAKAGDMLYLFNASGFGGVFSSQAPSFLAPSYCNEDGGSPENTCNDLLGPCADDVCEARLTQCIQGWDACIESNAMNASKFTYTNYFILGDGDVASLWDELYKIRDTKTHAVRGQVRDEVTRQAVEPGLSVLIYEGSDCDDATILSHAFTTVDGRFEFQLPDGDYCYTTTNKGRPVSDPEKFKVSGKSPDFIEGTAMAYGKIVASVTDDEGNQLPFKLTAVGTHDFFEGQSPREFLVDLAAGEARRPSDVIDDSDDPETRRFIEEMAYSHGTGTAEILVRPGTYEVYLSRGIEYEIVTQEIEVKPGTTSFVDGTLERAIDTTGYLNGDLHLHAFGSIDSGLDNNVRVRSLAGEGVEVGVSTDHNYVTDYQPYIQRNDLAEFLNSTVGLELTTFEAGHFNAFPVQFQIDNPSRGSFRWQDIPPQQIFNELRELGNDENIIQVNHPRTPILGYFSQHNVNAFDATFDLAINEAETAFSASVIASPNGPAFYTIEEGPLGENIYKSTFSWDFDAIEIFNGPHLEELRHFRMPFDKTAPSDDPDALPTDTYESLRTATLEPFVDDDPGLNAELAAFRSTPDMEVTVEEIEMLSTTERDAAIDEYVLSKIPNQYDIICDGASIAHAGALDDWYNLLNTTREDGQYLRFTATGNSDSHKARIDDPGYPRNFFYTGHDQVRTYNDGELVKAMREHRNIVSNGPFVEMWIDDEPIGSEITASGSVELRIKIQAAKWVGADRFRIVKNGETVFGLEDNQDDEFWGWVPISLEDGPFEKTYTIDVDEDSWFVVEVEGDNSLFPLVAPQDLPPFNFADVIGSLAGAFGLGGGIPGLEPEFVFAVTPFAFTNPIWVVADGDGEFNPTNPPTLKCEDGLITPNAFFDIDPRELDAMKNGRLKAGKIPEIHGEPSPLRRPKGEARDVRILFEAFGGHSH